MADIALKLRLRQPYFSVNDTTRNRRVIVNHERERPCVDLISGRDLLDTCRCTVREGSTPGGSLHRSVSFQNKRHIFALAVTAEM